jgi:hypothetical protein
MYILLASNKCLSIKRRGAKSTHHDIVTLHVSLLLSKFFALQFEAEKIKFTLLQMFDIFFFQCQNEKSFLQTATVLKRHFDD